jgi:hypothetical protein
MIGKELLEKILRKFIGDSSENAVRTRMEAGIPKIVAGMTSKNMTLQSAAPDVVIRDALFRLWRVVIPSGDIADMFRDSQEDEIKPKVREQITPTTSLQQVVELTKEAALELTF